MNTLILKVGIDYIKTETDLENMHCATDENGKELNGLRLCRWLFNYIMESKQKIFDLQDKLSRRNMQIKELKKTLNSIEIAKANHHFTAEEIEVIRDILVNSGQDKFKMSYPLMASICNKIGKLWYEYQEAETEKRAILRQDL